jgi:bifunctional non-homologous end joining protein LigD
MARRASKRVASAARNDPAPAPVYIAPCLARNAGRPPSGDKWAHEIKFDGFRTQLHLCNGKVTAFSTGQHDWTERYKSIVEEAAQVKAEHAVFDGEMVVLRDDGTCDFWALQKDVRSGNSDRLSFCAFDVLFCGGDLRKRPFVERKEKLKELIATGPQGRLIYSQHVVDVDGPTMWAHAHGINVEGIVSKRLDSPYRSARSDDWIKTPCEYREELLVAGIAYDDEQFGGLYLARQKDGRLIYAGKVEDGFTDEAVPSLLALLKPMAVRKQSVPTSTPKPDAQWVEPVAAVCIMHRGGLTAERVRRPVFEGIVEQRTAKRKTPPAVQTRSIGVPKENIQRLLTDAVVPTSAQLRAHWCKYGSRALEHIGHRPLTLVRHVDGLTFFHHGPLPETSSSVHKLEMRKADGSKGIRLWVDSVQGLLDLVEIGVVEVHPWAATVRDIERPDVLILDLDPGDGIEWEFVVETALELRVLLKAEGFDCWPKLTGGTGLHLMAPIEPELAHKQVHAYAIDIAQRIAKRNPEKYTTIAGATNRIGKLFIDHLRNGRGFTAIGAYSPRARAGLPFARPVTWKEVKRGLRSGAYQLGGGRRRRE